MEFILPDDFNDQNERDELHDLFGVYHTDKQCEIDQEDLLLRLKERSRKLLDYFVQIGGEDMRQVVGFSQPAIEQAFGRMEILEAAIYLKLHPEELEGARPIAKLRLEIEGESEVPDSLPDDVE